MSPGRRAGTFLRVYDVIIASKPGELMIHDALSSILQQTLTPARVIVVVDADEYVPGAWWDSVAARSPSVELLLHPDRGMAGAVSAGIRYASSAYVAFLDADDLWMPDKQFRQVGALDADRALHAVTCSARNTVVSVGDTGRQSPAVPCATFTATTFRAESFQRFGFPDSAAGHHAWLYRWWSQARTQGIRARHIPYLGLERRIHGRNSWCLENEIGHKALLAELRRIVRTGGDHLVSPEEVCGRTTATHSTGA